MALIGCIPNVSEGQRANVVDALGNAVRGVSGVRLLDVSSDSAHNRSVLTIVGDLSTLRTAILALFEVATAMIDLRSHTGVHPRIGAVDVVPFVPIQDVTLEECAGLARKTALAVAQQFLVPVYLYEAAASAPSRRNLADVRRGQFEGLVSKMSTPGWAPDFGPSAPHPTAGATAIGARGPLIAYNINLNTTDLSVAQHIAAAVRERDGGLRHVKALGVPLPDRGIVQVSMNLTDYEETSIFEVFDAVTREAARHRVDVLESEIVGLVPSAALAAGDTKALRLARPTPAQVLERRLRQPGQ